MTNVTWKRGKTILQYNRQAYAAATKSQNQLNGTYYKRGRILLRYVFGPLLKKHFPYTIC